MNTFSDPRHIVEDLPIFSGQKVADFGAGSGTYTLALAKKVQGSQEGAVYAVEIRQDLVELIGREAQKAGLTNVFPVWGDVDDLGGSRLRDGSMNAVVLANVLFQVENRGGVIDEAHRVLGFEGVLVVVDWTESFGNIGPHQDHVVTKDAASLLLDEHGFTVERSFSAGAHHYGLIARKRT